VFQRILRDALDVPSPGSVPSFFFPLRKFHGGGVLLSISFLIV